jgi:hypothetical protein
MQDECVGGDVSISRSDSGLELGATLMLRLILRACLSVSAVELAVLAQWAWGRRLSPVPLCGC